jgi:Tfp pilus assembly protein PilP
MKRLSLTFATLAIFGSVAFAQATPPATPAVDPSAVKTPAAPDAPGSGAEEAHGFNYNPEGRRDPFVSLLRRGIEASNSGPRAGGVSGLGTGEVSLRGVVASEGAFVGILQGVDSKNYIVRVGDRLSDGTIRSITADSMVILQQVNDPLSLEKQREVRKLLRQTEEAK